MKPTREEDGKWKKGHCPNPNGAPKSPITRDVAREIVYTELDNISMLVFGGTLEELAKLMAKNNPARMQLTPAANVFLTHIAQSNLKAIGMLLDRIVGRPKQTLEVGTTDKFTIEDFLRVTKENNEKTKDAKKLSKIK